MRYRKDIIEHLYMILAKNIHDGKIYQNASERCKRLLFKNFFRKLSHQKRSFCKRIKYEISVLEDEVLSMGGELKERENFHYEIKPQVLPVFRLEKDGLIKECYRREKENLVLYNTLLSKICVGQIREMLLFQKHSVKLILNEIESMGLKVYDEKNEHNYK